MSFVWALLWQDASDLRYDASFLKRRYSKLKTALGKVILLLSLQVLGQSTDAYGEAPLMPMVIERPGMGSLVKATRRNCMPSAKAMARVAYDAEGIVTDASLLDSTGVKDVDMAIVTWLHRIKITPGEAGIARIPFELADGLEPPTLAGEPIRDCDVVRWPSEEEIREALSVFDEIKAAQRVVLKSPYSGARSLKRLVIAWDHAGDVTKIWITGVAGNDRGQIALDALAKKFGMRPGLPGEGFLYIVSTPEDEIDPRPGNIILRSIFTED